MANAATGIRNVTGIPGNDVDVEVWNRLARCLADIDANVEAGRCVSTLHSLAGRGDALRQGSSLSWRGIEPARHMAACHHERMTVRNGKGIPHAED